MKWPTIALIGLLVLSFVGIFLPRVPGLEIDEWPVVLRWGVVGAILTAMAIIGWDERRREKEADKWADDPRRSAFENWIEKRRQRFSPARGLRFFLLGGVVFTIITGISAMLGEVASIGGALAFVIIMSVAAGLIGMFTEKVPL